MSTFWNSVVLFETNPTAKRLLQLCSDWHKGTEFELTGYALRSSLETIFVETFEDLEEGLLSSPALGRIYTAWPDHGLGYSIEISIGLYSVYHNSQVVDYLTCNVSKSGYEELPITAKRDLYFLHTHMLGSLPQTLWMTVGLQKRTFLSWIPSAEELERWRHGEDLTALDYTWASQEFYQRIKKPLPELQNKHLSKLISDTHGQPFYCFQEPEIPTELI